MADIGTCGNPVRGVMTELSQLCRLPHALPATHQQSTWEAPKEAKYKKGQKAKEEAGRGLAHPTGHCSSGSSLCLFLRSGTK